MSPHPRHDRFVTAVRTIHSVIRKGLARAAERWEALPPGELRGFGLYSKAVLRSLQEHHRHEDEILFPVFRQKQLRGWSELGEPLARAHRELEEELARALPMVDRAIAGDASLRPELARVFSRIQEHALSHLAQEEAWLAVDVLVDGAVSPQDLDAMDHQIAEMNKKAPDGAIVMPFVLWSSDDAEYDASWRIEIPAFVRKVVVRWLMWPQARHVAPYCDHVRSTWDA